MDVTLKNNWQHYASKAWPHVEKNSLQYKGLEQSWYAASFDVLNTIMKLAGADDLDDDESAELLASLIGEAEKWIEEDVIKSLREYN